MTFNIAILGKPNVGKSTLFNRLCGKKLAIVDDRPGVTRDRKMFPANLAGLKFNVIDTAGWEGSEAGLPKLMAQQSLHAGEEADIIFFMVDARNGINIDDIGFAHIIRCLSKPTILVVNKCDSKKNFDLESAYKLGLGEPIFISAQTREGLDDLHAGINKLSKTIKKREDILPASDPSHLKVCIVGRPNVGKSTLFNSMLQMERSITSPVAGTTRDAIQHLYTYNERVIELIDTAGLRKKKSINDSVESMSVGESINAIRRSNVVVLVIDATQPLEKQDLSIAHIAINEGKAVVLVVNKMDLIENVREFTSELKYLIGKNLNELQGMPILQTVALNGIDNNALFELIIQAERRWRFEISTGQLNRWMQKVTTAHIPPLANSGKRIRFKYATQTSTKPPTFTMFVNVPEELPDSYTKYLINSMRDKFDLGGIPTRILYRKNENPFV